MPPPGKIFKSKHTDSRKRAREKLQRELEESLAHRSRQIFAAIFAWGQPNPAAPLFFCPSSIRVKNLLSSAELAAYEGDEKFG